MFVYDEDHLRARCREAVSAFGDGVAYGSKAFLCMAMARLVHEETGMPTRLAEDPLSTVAEGAGMALDEIEVMTSATGSRRGGVAIGRR